MQETKEKVSAGPNSSQPIDAKPLPADLEGLLLEMERVSKEAEDAILRSQKQQSTPGKLPPLRQPSADPFLDSLLGTDSHTSAAEKSSLPPIMPQGANAEPVEPLPSPTLGSLVLELAEEPAPSPFILDMPQGVKLQPAPQTANPSGRPAAQVSAQAGQLAGQQAKAAPQPVRAPVASPAPSTDFSAQLLQAAQAPLAQPAPKQVSRQASAMQAPQSAPVAPQAQAAAQVKLFAQPAAQAGAVQTPRPAPSVPVSPIPQVPQATAASQVSEKISPTRQVLDPKAASLANPDAVDSSQARAKGNKRSVLPVAKKNLPVISSAKKAPKARNSKRAPVQRVLGVDFSGASLVIAESRGVNTLVTLAAVPIPPQMTILSQDGFLFLREQLLRVCGTLQNIGIWVMAPDESAEARHVRVPIVSPSELQNVVFWTVKREKDVDEGIYAMDYRKCPTIWENGVERQPVTVSLVRKDFMDRVSSLCQYVDLRLLGITPRAMAVQNLFDSAWLEAPAAQSAVMFLEDTCTHIYILRDGHVALSRTVKTGLNSLVSGLFESYQSEIASNLANGIEDTRTFTQEDAFHLLVEGVFPMLSGFNPPNDDEVVERIDSALSRLERQIERSLSNFNSASGVEPVSRLLLCVPKACENLLSQYFSTNLNIEAKPLALPTRMAPNLLADFQKAGVALPACLPAVGLSLSSEAYTPNSFIPLSLIELERKKRRGMLGIHVACWALTGIFVMSGIMAWWDVVSLKNQNTMVAKVLQEEAAVSPEEVLEAANNLESMRNSLAALHKKRAMASFVAELAQITPSSIQLANLRMISQNAPSRMGNETGSATAIISGSLSGDILQREALLTDYLYRLQTSPLIMSITVEKVLSGDKVTNFTATLKLV